MNDGFPHFVNPSLTYVFHAVGQVLDAKTLQWVLKTKLSQPRKKLAAATSGHFVVFAGG